jgi:hypothetical protein
VREDYENKQSERGRYRKIQKTGRSREIREVPGSEIQTGPGWKLHERFVQNTRRFGEDTERLGRDREDTEWETQDRRYREI